MEGLVQFGDVFRTDAAAAADDRCAGIDPTACKQEIAGWIEVFAQVADAAAGWDGSDPIREGWPKA